ncbi:uncharacterized protein LOC132725588 isoform X2 [Ruditapes philippinarum]|uniref:uncharacterized protein LOC132725588 isoform X2 n=1 Tax=Ruditapes philippinarum TaxID=129788 RepID=UPI00295B37A1|nr:uncharacterized protein LOC132725588 isoform X2 [Ruditapes philippinarum]
MTLRIAKRIFKCLVTSAIVLEIILVALIITWFARRQRPMESMLCFSDESLKSAGWKSEILQNLTLGYGKDTTQNETCFETVAVLNPFVRQLMIFRYDADINPEHHMFNLTIFNHVNKTISTDLPALLQLKDIKMIESSEQENRSKIFWKSSISQGVGLDYFEEEGVIAIQKSGYYHVATHLTIMKENETISAADELASHQVIRISDKTDKESVLLENISVQCHMPTKQREQSSDMAAAFKLEKRDKIFVTFSHPYKIVSGNGGHFFSIVEI